MGRYLNSKKPHAVYKNAAKSAYFADKTAMLDELIPLVEFDEYTAGQNRAYQGGGRPVYLHNKAAPVWKDACSQYDSFLFWKRLRQPERI